MPLPPVAQQQDLLSQQEEERARKKASNAEERARKKASNAEERARKKAASDAAKTATKLALAEERAPKKVASDAAKKVATEKTLKKNAEAKLALAEAKKAALDLAKEKALLEAMLARTQKALEKSRRGKAPKPASEKPPARGRKRHEILENFVLCEKCLKWRPTDREWEEEEQYRCGDNQRDWNYPEDKEDE